MIESGNGMKFEKTIYMDEKGNIVQSDIVQTESLAFSNPLSLDLTKKDNSLVFDEIGDNTHCKDDGNNGGEKTAVPKGHVSREIVGVQNSRYTITRVNDLNGYLRASCVIFAAE